MADSALFACIGQKTAGQYEKEGYSQPAAPDCMGKHMKQGNPRDSQGPKAIKPWNAVSLSSLGRKAVFCIRSSVFHCCIFVFHLTSFYPACSGNDRLFEKAGIPSPDLPCWRFGCRGRSWDFSRKAPVIFCKCPIFYIISSPFSIKKSLFFDGKKGIF